jgi:hypothetical protein
MFSILYFLKLNFRVFYSKKQILCKSENIYSRLFTGTDGFTGCKL